VHAFLAELRVTQTRDRVVLVQALLRLAGGFDVPLVQRALERARDLLRELGLAGAGLPLISRGRASVIAAFTAIISSSVAMY